MAYTDSSSTYEASPTQHYSVAHQQEITRTRVYVAMGFILNSVGNADWLKALTDEEFEHLLAEIIPVIEAEKESRRNIHPRMY